MDGKPSMRNLPLLYTTIRSIPPSSSNFAESPFPAPATMIGLPAEIVARSLASTCPRVYRSTMQSRETSDVFKAILVSIVEHCHCADRRGGALAPFEWQADKLKFAMAN